MIQAYSQCAQETLKYAPLIQKEIYDVLEISYSYDQTSLISALFEKYEVKVVEEVYANQVKQKLQINRGYTEVFKREVFDKSKGTLKV